MADDPGWNIGAKAIARGLNPFVPIERRLVQGVAPVVQLRQLFISFAIGLALVTVVVVVLGDQVDGTEPLALSAGIVTVSGILSLLAPSIVRSRLDGSSTDSLVASYRTRFFLRIAFAESAALAAFAIALALGPWWVYFIGLACSIVGFVRLAPTRAHIEAEERALFDRGSDVALRDALYTPPG